MVQFSVLSGKKAGAQRTTRRFPFHIGRAPDNELCLEEDGVWDRHLTVEFHKPEGFMLATAPNALATLNGQPVQTARLRSGDIIAVGSAKLQFWLGAVRQRGLRFREGFVWTLLAGVVLAQFALIYWLP
jgi:pSer/pThr/pTyr-binding forkhead associated (FHA) protein